MRTHVALSFSGGKDSCFALHRLQQQNIHVACLLTTIWKGNQRSVAHEETRERILAQAESLSIPVHFMETNFENYTADFVQSLKEIKRRYSIEGAAFGDIYLEGHREWGESVVAQAGLQAVYPLWTGQENVLQLLSRFVKSGFKADVIKIDDTKLPKSWVGRAIDETFIADIRQYDVCPMGESGEYHTTVYDGPVFAYPVKV